jgi:hypothetical protein
MAYRVRAGETASVPSVRTRWGEIPWEGAPRSSDACTPMPFDPSIAFPSACSVRKALVPTVAPKPVRDVACSQPSDHRLLPTAPAHRVDGSSMPLDDMSSCSRRRFPVATGAARGVGGGPNEMRAGPTRGGG